MMGVVVMIYRSLYNVLSLLRINYSYNITISPYWNPTAARIRSSRLNTNKIQYNYALESPHHYIMRQKVSCETWSLDPKNNVFIRAQTVIKLTRTSGGARHQGGGGGGGIEGQTNVL